MNATNVEFFTQHKAVPQLAQIPDPVCFGARQALDVTLIETASCNSRGAALEASTASKGNALHQPFPAAGVHRQLGAAVICVRGSQDPPTPLAFQHPGDNSHIPICQLCRKSETSTWGHLETLCLLAQNTYALALAYWSYT